MAPPATPQSINKFFKDQMEQDGRADVLEAMENVIENVGLGEVMRAKTVREYEKVFDRLSAPRRQTQKQTFVTPSHPNERRVG